MRKVHTIIFSGLMILLMLGGAIQPAQADDTPLPASTWYAVIWNRADDTLHWVNNATELASIPRPKLPGEAGEIGPDLRVYISPNGRYLMQHALLENERQGIGFYDLENGVWLQTHEAQPGEFFIQAARNPFSQNSELAAIGLTSDDGWRILTFETATGNVIDQFDENNPAIPADYIPQLRAPSVAFFQLDEGLAQWRIHIRFIQLGGNPEPTPQPALVWTPATDAVAISELHPLLWDFDVLPMQSRFLYSLNDGAQAGVYSRLPGQEAETIYEQAGAFANRPRWVAGGQFVAFQLTQGAQVPMWYLGAYGFDNFTPFGPDYDELLGTIDGFVLVDYNAGEVKFANTLAFEAFTPTLGNTIYTSDTPGFEIVYITPMGINFTLTSLATPPDSPEVVNGPDGVQAPELTCGTAPPPRLTVGETARVTFTDGSALNIRTAADGDLIMQLPEGTLVDVVGGPVCADNYVWWQIAVDSENISVGGWAAEGDDDDYWLEPLAQVEIGSLPEPAPTLAIQAVTPLPPNATGPGDGDCSNAPIGAELTVGGTALTINLGGTLAMRTEITDEFPSNQVPNNQFVTVLDGPECNAGFRMWYVTTLVNGVQVTGWVADGFGQTRYLQPGQ